jgi:hypothetical protein
VVSAIEEVIAGDVAADAKVRNSSTNASA